MKKQKRFGINDWLRLIATVAWLVVFVSWPRMTAGLSLLAVGAAVIVFNAMIFRARVVKNDDAPAVAPLFGGVFAAAGMVMLPVEGIWKWAWIPLLLDWGGLPMFVAAWFNNRKQKKRRSG